jgi:hypothetical protein
VSLAAFEEYNEYWQERAFYRSAVVRAETISEHIDSNSTILDIGWGEDTLIGHIMCELNRK